jgi:hypothetical protein
VRVDPVQAGKYFDRLRRWFSRLMQVNRIGAAQAEDSQPR